MDFTLSDEHRHIQETIRDFGEREVKPHAAEWDRTEQFPHETVRRLGALGCPLLEGPIQVPDGPRIAFLRAPDDTRIELIEPPRKPGTGGC